jgi:hypothetical protein
MLRTPLASKVAGRTIGFSTGDPSKDRILMGASIAVIVLAAGAMVWSLGRPAKTSVADQVITRDVALLCVNPQCSHKTDMNRQDYYRMLDEQLTDEDRHAMPIRTLCPDCSHQAKTVIQGAICPNCRQSFVPADVLFGVRRMLRFPAQPPTSQKLICPHCSTDITEYRAQQRTQTGE